MIPGWRLQYLRYRTFLLNIVSHYKRRRDLKVYLEIFLSLATISLFSVFALRPTLLTIGELITEIEAKKETLIVIDKKLANLRNAQRLYDSERTRIQLLENSIPSAPNPDLLALQFEGVSSEVQIPLERLSISRSVIKGASDSKPSAQPDKSPTPESTLNFSFQTSARYQTVVEVVKNLQNLQRLLDIKSITLGASEEGDQAVVLTMSGNSLYLNLSGGNE